MHNPNFRNETSQSAAVVEPRSIDNVLMPEDAQRYLKQMRSSAVNRAKVVLGIYNGQGIVTVGPERHYHVALLDFGTHELEFRPSRIVTTVNHADAKPIPGALIQGSRFTVTDWDTPSVLLHDASDTFGGYKGRILGRDADQLVREVLLRELRRIAGERGSS